MSDLGLSVHHAETRRLGHVTIGAVRAFGSEPDTVPVRTDIGRESDTDTITRLRPGRCFPAVENPTPAPLALDC